MALTKATYSMIDGASANILDFGVDPTGVADSTAAFQAALDSGAAAVYVPAGTYKITASLNMAANQTLYGEGRASVISFVSNSLTDNRRIKTHNNTVVRDLAVTETGVTGRTGYYGLITSEGRSDVIVTNVYVYGSSSIGIMNVNSTNVMVDGCFVSDTQADGIHSQRGSSYITVRNCIITNPGDDGIAFVSHDYTLLGNVHHCIAEGNIVNGTLVTGSGVASVGAMHVTIANNIIADTQLVGIRITGASFVGEGDTVGGHIVVVGNQINNTGLSGSGELGGIYVDSNRYVQIKDNLIFNTPSYGIACSTCWVDIDIHDNTICNVAENGIYATANAQTGYYLQLWTNPYLDDGTTAATVCGQTISIKDNSIRSAGGTGIFVTGTVTESVNVVDIRGNAMYRLHTDNTITPAYAIRADYCTNISESDNVSLSPVNALTQAFTATGSSGFDGVTNTNIPLQNGLSPNGSAFVGTNRHYSNGAAPVSGTYALGDFVWNFNPASGVLGWVCTTAGTPGTWTPVNVN